MNDLNEALDAFSEVDVLGPGDIFGEEAMVSTRGKEMHTVKARTPCKFACLDREVFINVFGKMEKKKLDAKIDFFHNIPIFNVWAKSMLG